MKINQCKPCGCTHTGSLVKYGAKEENENGTAVKFSDGTMICRC